MFNDFYDNKEYEHLGGSSVKCYEVKESIFNIYFSHGQLFNGNVPRHLREQHFYRVNVNISGEDVFYGTFSGNNFLKLKILMEEKANSAVIIGWLLSNNFLDIEKAFKTIIASSIKLGREEQQKLFREVIGCRC